MNRFNWLLVMVFLAMLAFVILLKTGRLEAMGVGPRPSMTPIPEGLLSDKTDMVLWFRADVISPASLYGAMERAIGEATFKRILDNVDPEPEPEPESDDLDPGPLSWLGSSFSLESTAEVHREFLAAGGRASVVLSRDNGDAAIDGRISLFSLRDPGSAEQLHQWIMTRGPEWATLNASVVGPWLIYHDPDLDLRAALRDAPNPRLLAAVAACEQAPLAIAGATSKRSPGSSGWNSYGFALEWGALVFETSPASVKFIWTDGENKRHIRIQAGSEPLPAAKPAEEKVDTPDRESGKTNGVSRFIW
jgi:hypothetical protein